MKDDEIKRFKALASKYELQASDFWKSPQGFVIISRRGIEKIQNGLKAVVYLETVPEFSSPLDNKFVIKAIGHVENEDKSISKMTQTYGESSPKNTRGGAQAYPIAMAEKRALSRCILKMSDMYTLNVFGEDEINE
jgi:hypothetical protein